MARKKILKVAEAAEATIAELENLLAVKVSEDKVGKIRELWELLDKGAKEVKLAVTEARTEAAED